MSSETPAGEAFLQDLELERRGASVSAPPAHPPTDDPSTPSGLSRLLEEVEAFVRRFVSFQNDHQSAAVTLWVAHVCAIEAAPSAAYLHITSAAEESGKTTLLEALEQLLGKDRAVNAVSISPAAVFRWRDKRGPLALLLDEIDNTLHDRQDDGARDLLAIINAGYRRSATVVRTTGQNHEPREFAAFGPAAIAGLGSLHPTTESRCIPIVLERKTRGSGERWLPFLIENETAELRERLAAWATDDVIETLRLARPALPEELRDRHAEAWWGLFAIADVASGDWPARARTAATVLHASRDTAATLTLRVLLLEHVRQAFEEAATDRLASAALIRLLVENEEGPWGRFWGAELARGDTPHAAQTDIAAKLRDFHRLDGEPIKPHVVRLPDGSTPRGYALDDFADAFARYLSPPGGGATPATPATPLASPVAPVAAVAGGVGEQGSGDVRDRIAAELEAGTPAGDIAERLNAEGCPPPPGAGSWNPYMVNATATGRGGLA